MRFGNKAAGLGALLAFGILSFSAIVSGAASEDPEARTERLREMRKREAYYHFFLWDYLESATRLKLIPPSEPGTESPKMESDVEKLLGGIYFVWGMDRAAAEIFGRLADAAPEGIERNRILYVIERFEYTNGLYREAAETHGKLSAAGRWPGKNHADYMAGMSRLILGEQDQAVDLLNAVDPKSRYYPFARYAIAQAEVQRKNDGAAQEILGTLSGNEAVEEDPALGAFAERARLTYALFRVERNDFGEAHRVLSAFTESSPVYPESLFALGWVRFRTGYYADALLTFRKLIETAPDHPYSREALIAIGNCYARLKSVPLALESYGRAVEVYEKEADRYRELRNWAGDRGRFERWLDTKEGETPMLKSIIAGDRGLSLRFTRYRDLGDILALLERKHRDMDVFEVLVGHRETVYRDRLPSVRQFLDQDPVGPLRERIGALDRELAEAAGRNDPTELLSPEEHDRMQALDRMGRRLAAVSARLAERPEGDRELDAEIVKTGRWISIIRGEVYWKGMTEFPGRLDDAQRELDGLKRELDAAAGKRLRLAESVPSLQEQFGAFRGEIRRLRGEIETKLAETRALRERLVPILQHLLSNSIDQQLKRYEQWAAAARFGQIQAADLSSKP